MLLVWLAKISWFANFVLVRELGKTFANGAIVFELGSLRVCGTGVKEWNIQVAAVQNVCSEDCKDNPNIVTVDLGKG